MGNEIAVSLGSSMSNQLGMLIAIVAVSLAAAFGGEAGSRQWGLGIAESGITLRVERSGDQQRIGSPDYLAEMIRSR